MYDNNEFRIHIEWKNVLIKLVLIILFVLLLVWVLPIPKLDTFYNRVFNDNINTMKEAAKNYFLSNNLPENIGESNTIKLGDMVNKNLIVEFTDKNNNKCSDSNSLSTITKTDSNEYVLKTMLTCGEENDYVLETLINYTNNNNNVANNNVVNGNSNDNNVDKKPTSNSLNNEEDDEEDLILENGVYDKDGNLTGITEYEFKKPIYNTTNTYTCPQGYVLKGKTCYKYESGETISATPLYFDDITTIKDALKNVTGSYKVYADAIKEKDKVNKTCPDGYTLNNGVCYTYIEATVKPGTTKYECPAGYSLKGTKCIDEIEPNYRVIHENEYKCPDGYTLSGSKCTITKNAQVKYESEKEYYCSYASDRLLGTSCYYNATYHSGGSSCSCNPGDQLVGSICYKTESYAPTYTPGSQSCSCPSGTTASGNQCVSTYTATNNSHWGNPTVIQSNKLMNEYNNGSEKLEYTGKYNCSLSGCTYYYNKYKWEKSYSCPNGGSLSGTTCYKYSQPNCSTGGGSYKCSDGTYPVNNVCYRKTTYNANCSTSNGYYTCSKKGTLLGTSCYYAASYRTNSSSYEYCDTGYTLSNHKCSRTVNAELVNADLKIPYCDNDKGYYLDDNNMCVKTIDATKNTTETQYTCPEGYTKEGTTCYKTIEPTEEITYKYSCPEDYELTNKDNKPICFKEIESTTEYYCEDKEATLQGDKCIVNKKGGLKGYTCPKDYILNGDKCVLERTTCIDATLETNTTTTYEYTWSTNKYLEGWTPTGNTRVTSANDYIK